MKAIIQMRNGDIHTVVGLNGCVETHIERLAKEYPDSVRIWIYILDTMIVDLDADEPDWVRQVRITDRAQIRRIIEEASLLDEWDQDEAGDPWTAVQVGVMKDGRTPFTVHYSVPADEPEPLNPDDQWYYDHAAFLEFPEVL